MLYQIDTPGGRPLSEAIFLTSAVGRLSGKKQEPAVWGIVRNASGGCQ
jgi:hypothetical protein